MKKLTCLILAMVMVFALAACSSPGETATETASAEITETASAETTETASVEASPTEFEETTLVFQTGGTEGTISGDGCRMIKEYIEEATGGKVSVDLYYNYALYPQDQVLPALMGGNIDMCVTQSSFVADYMPKIGTLAVPYLFKSVEQQDEFYSSDIWSELKEEMAQETGIYFLGYNTMGARTVNLAEDRKVTSRADLESVKLRMPNTEAWQFLGKALGANPIPLSGSEIYLALQTGTVDGQDNPVMNIIDMCLYEVTKSVTLTNHYFLGDWFVIREDLWETLSPQLQNVIEKAVEEATSYVTETYAAKLVDDIEFLEENGVSVYELTDEELDSYSQEVLDYYFSAEGDEITANWDMDLYQAIKELSN